MANRQVSKGEKGGGVFFLVSVKGLSSSSSFPPSDKITAPLSGGRDKGGGEKQPPIWMSTSTWEKGGEREREREGGVASEWK